jgi:NAD-dependent dihydropyrimidine dehydrogenase PreA subunit
MIKLLRRPQATLILTIYKGNILINTFGIYYFEFTFAIINNQNSQTMAYVINDECTACGVCLDECPEEAISEGDIYVIDPEKCTDCGSCADVCPVEAIHPE